MESKKGGNRGKLNGRINSNNYDLGGMGEKNGSTNRIGERCRRDKENKKRKKKEKGRGQRKREKKK